MTALLIFLIVLVVTIPIIIFIVGILLGCFVTRRRVSRLKLDFKSRFKQLTRKLRFNEKNFHQNTVEQIGSGHFSEVYKATLIKPVDGIHNVSIKVLRDFDPFDPFQVKEFFDEVENFITINQHENVLSLLGVYCPSNQNQQNDQVFRFPGIVTHLMNEGDAESYLKPVNAGGRGQQITVGAAISLCLQAVDGLSHLHQVKILHRDMAARNCLLRRMSNGELQLKISDYGLACKGEISKHLYSYTIIQKYRSKKSIQLAFMWLAPEIYSSEAKDRELFSEKSDIWSLGVTFWEFFTLCQIPYKQLLKNDTNHSLESIPSSDRILDFLDKKKRLQKPIFCDDNAYGVLLCISV